MWTAQTRRALAVAMALAWILLAWPSRAFALNPALDISQYAHTAWRIRDGFSKGAIRSIAQTPDGYLWLGTEFGMLRFDGVRAVPWQPPPDQPLPSDDIWSLLATRDGALWIGTAKGVARWKDGRLTVYGELAGRIVVRPSRRPSEHGVGKRLVRPDGTLCAIRSRDGECSGDDGGFGLRRVRACTRIARAALWLGVDKRASGDGRPARPGSFRLPGEANGIRALDEDADGALLLTTRRRNPAIRRWPSGDRTSLRGPTIRRERQPPPARS